MSFAIIPSTMMPTAEAPRVALAPGCGPEGRK
jgi:hypothetical protein